MSGAEHWLAGQGHLLRVRVKVRVEHWLAGQGHLLVKLFRQGISPHSDAYVLFEWSKFDLVTQRTCVEYTVDGYRWSIQISVSAWRSRISESRC